MVVCLALSLALQALFLQRSSLLHHVAGSSIADFKAQFSAAPSSQPLGRVCPFPRLHRPTKSETQVPSDKSRDRLGRATALSDQFGPRHRTAGIPQWRADIAVVVIQMVEPSPHGQRGT
jgi:hypothetical protein